MQQFGTIRLSKFQGEADNQNMDDELNYSLDKDTGIVVNSHYHHLLPGLHTKPLGSSWKKSGWNYKLQ
jgi:hypothetical protein